jgi:hypothetical protein
MDMVTNNLVPTPGTEGNQPLGALSQMQQMRGQLQDQLGQARTNREEARSSLDQYYQKAIDSLQKPVQDNTWLHLALGALQPSLPWESGVLRGAQAATMEQQREQDINRENALLANKLGAQWQQTRLGEFRDEADKLLAALGKTTSSGMMGKWVQSKDDQGNLYWTNNVTGEQRIVPASKLPLWEKTYSEAYKTAIANEYPNPDDFAKDFANKSIAVSPRGVVASDVAQPATVPVAGVPGTSQNAVQVPPLVPRSAAPQKGQVGIIPANLPPDVQSEIERQIARLQANPNDPILQRNTLNRLRQLAAQYPQAAGAVSDTGQIVPAGETAQQTQQVPASAFPYLDKVQRAQDLQQSEATGKNLAEYEKALSDKSDSAMVMQRNLGHMLDEAKSANFGAGANFKTQALKWADTLGVPLSDSEKAAMTGNQVIGKIGLQLATIGAKNISSRPTQLEFQKLMEEGVPSTGMTKDAFVKVLNLFNETASADQKQLSEFTSWKHNIKDKNIGPGDFSNYWSMKMSNPKLQGITPKDIADTMQAKGWTYQQVMDKLRGVQ